MCSRTPHAFCCLRKTDLIDYLRYVRRTAAAIWTSVVTNVSATLLPPLSLAVGRIALTVAGVMAERGGPVAYAPAYRRTLNWQPPLAPQPPPAAAPAGNTALDTSSTTVTVAVAVAVPCGVVLLVAVGVAVWAKRRLQRRSRKGGLADAVKPPGAGPDTTLLVTDIQSSTSLWEHLDAGVMDRALSTHHAVMRKAIADWHGYESATE
jgi:hypothetical protein